jgi:hypothetical protein
VRCWCQLEVGEVSLHKVGTQLISCSVPLQVNKIREVPGYESIIVTHTDAPELYVWSLERQPDRAQDRVCH